MKKYHMFLLLFVGTILFSCSQSIKKDPKMEQVSSTQDQKPSQSSVPSDEVIQRNCQDKWVKIIGKQKVSDNEFNVYYFRGNEINYSQFVLVRLDNGTWLLKNPGYWCRIIE